MVTSYTPERGDIIYINHNPQKGREQAGKRPAVVISPRAYNQKVGLILCCPITSRSKGYPFEVELKYTEQTQGVVLADQMRTMDWQARGVQLIEQLDQETMDHLLRKVRLLVE